MALDPHSTGQIQEFLTVLRRRRWQILLPALFVVTLGSVFAVIVPKRFVLHTEVEVREGPRVGVEQDPGPRGYSSIREIDNAKWHLRHHRRVKSILDAQGELWDDYVKLDDREKDEYVSRVLKRIGVEQRNAGGKQGSEFVDITYQDVDGNRGEIFLTALVDAWINMVVDRDREQLRIEIDDLQNQADEARKAYGEVARAYNDLAKSMHVDPLQPLYDQRTRSGGDTLVATRDRLVNQSLDLDVQIKTAQAALDVAQRDYDEAEKFIPRPILSKGLDYMEEITQIERQILQLESKRSRLKPEHSQWKKIQGQIDEGQQRIRDLKSLTKEPGTSYVNEPNPELTELGLAVHQANRRLVELKQEKKTVDGKIQELTGDVEARIGNIGELERLRGEKATLFEVMHDLEQDLYAKQRQEKTLLRTYAEPEHRPYEVVMAARAKSKPETPNPWFIAIFSLVAGLALGGGIALAAEYARNSYRSVSEVAGLMAVPVLGAVNTIVTTTEARRAQMRRALIGFSSAVICGGLAWFTWIWAYSPERLPTELRQAIDDFRRLLM